MSNKLPEIHSAGLLAFCRNFGLPVPAEAHDEHASLWLSAPLTHPESLQSVLPCLSQSQVSEAIIRLRPEKPLLSWGVARLEEHYDEDLIQRPDDSAPWVLPRLTPVAEHHKLQSLFSDLRLTLGDRDWLVFWGESDNGQAWLLGVFPWGWNWPQGPWVELPDLAIPELISPLSQHLFQSAARDWLASLTDEAPESLGYDWLENLGGKLILPAPRWQALLGTAPGQIQTLALPAFKGLPGLKKRLKRLSQGIWETFIVPHQRFSGHLQQGREIFRLFLPAFIELGIWIRSLAEPLETSGVLPEALATHLNPSTRLRNELIQLWDSTQDLVRGDEPLEPKFNVLMSQPEFRQLWQLFMGHFGHHGSGALDLAGPRLADQPEKLFDCLLQPWTQEADAPARQPLNWLDIPRWRLLSWLIDLRESWLMECLWALHQLRQRMEKLAAEAVAKQLLPASDDLWWLGPDELKTLDAGQAVDPELIVRRKALYAHWHEAWRNLHTPTEMTPSADSTAGSIKGIGLKNGLTQGRIWRLQRAETHLPPGYDPDHTLLVTARIDPGWIPCLELVNGVILTQGDVYDSSAILLRELSKPAIVGLPEASAIEPGRNARLNADTGTLTVVAD